MNSKSCCEQPGLKRFLQALLLACLCLLSLAGAYRCKFLPYEDPVAPIAGGVTLSLQEYPHALRNAVKGFRGGWRENTKHYTTMDKWYIYWNNIENDESDTIDKIRDYFDSRWDSLAKQNMQCIPRIVLDYPSNKYWPADLSTGDYSSSQFKARLQRLISRLGQLWNDDPRIAYMEVGFIGQWGELHDPIPDSAMQTLLGDAYAAAFPDKKVMGHHHQSPSVILFDNYYNNGKFGIHWDCFSHPNETWLGQDILDLGDFWKNQPVGGEVTYLWDNNGLYGTSPTETLSTPAYTQYMVDQVRLYHTNHLGWISDYNIGQATADGAEQVQKALGYRFVIDTVTFTGSVQPGENLDIEFTVTNTGSSPIYYDWPLEVSLIDPDTKKAVWTAVLENVDISTWMPGDDYNLDTHEYDVPAVPVTVRQSVATGSDVPTGEYILALAILHPGNMKPNVRFANMNYFTGGRLPVGKIGIGVQCADHELSPDIFDDPQEDTTISYVN